MSSDTDSHTNSSDIREQLRAAIAHFDHVLPGQASIKDFVHHNTIHGYQHLEFPEALKQVFELTGNYAYLPAEQYRAYYQQGRISQDDLDTVLDADAELQAETHIVELEGCSLSRREVYRSALLHPFKPLTACRLNWQIEEQKVLETFQGDVSEAKRQQLRETSTGNSDAECVAALWQTCLEKLGLEYFLLHPEDLLDMSPQLDADILQQYRLAQTGASQSDDEMETQEAIEEPPALRQLRQQSVSRLTTLLADVGECTTLRGLLQSLSSRDILGDLRPLLLRHLAAYLDQGLAAWHHPQRAAGFYAAWKQTALSDPTHFFDSLPDYQKTVAALPDDPMDVVIASLQQLRLPQARWTAYLQQLALELPGWSGMVNWLAQRPGYADLPPVDMIDYLAVRLVLERLFAQRVCRDRWQLEANLDAMDTYFRAHYAEFLVRHHLYNTRLPEYLVDQAQHLANRSSLNPAEDHDWLYVAQLINSWRASPAGDKGTGTYSVYQSGWRLFRLCQHLGLSDTQLALFDESHIQDLFACLDKMDEQRSGFIWLQAYERHYRDHLLQALAANHGRGRAFSGDNRPRAQLMFCMDDREEGMRRHIEEQYPEVETLGAAGFFNLTINWRGLDDEAVTPLCPVVQVPSHEIREQAMPEAEALKQQHQQRYQLRKRIRNWLHHEVRRNLFTSTLLIAFSAPVALLGLLGKVLLPRQSDSWLDKLRRRFDLEVPTKIQFSSSEEAAATEPTPEHNHLGFSDEEQATRVEAFLRMVGLTSNFAPLVAMFGHGSGSQNNPHMAAYDCGACSGRHSGPNARTFAAIANRPEIRQRLRTNGLDIPDDTWFLGLEHNTCDEVVLWYDENLIPENKQAQVAELRQTLDYACRASAHERCRRLASAPDKPSAEAALHHVVSRAHDFSQARPELGHATNAAAFIGRRSATRGAFFDRRLFLISYDATQDPEGEIVEKILLAAGPVGAGINLEYYFSTVNNEQFGCGTKVAHNVTGFFGVMEGTSSDLRTGLPRQMIEIHEAMRLQVVVEANIDILTTIYQRQPPLQELVGKGWLLLSAKDPDSGDIHTFDPAQGWVLWQAKDTELPKVKRSPDWYQGHSGPLWPALVTTPEEMS